MTPEPAWVDLGLPSGLLWAKANLGGSVPESPGLYFSWGNTEGHPAGGGYDFSSEVYSQTPGASVQTNLTPESDAATVILGDNAKTPSDVDFQELIDNCESVWTNLNGMNGLMFTSNINGKSIFLPAAGICSRTTLSDRGIYGYYWTSVITNAGTARRVLFNSASIVTDTSYERRSGFTIRAVRSA